METGGKLNNVKGGSDMAHNRGTGGGKLINFRGGSHLAHEGDLW